jgi:hypothetical protein
MLGFGSLEVALAYLLSILAAIFCVVFGASRWNSRSAPDKVRHKHIITPKQSAGGQSPEDNG